MNCKNISVSTWQWGHWHWHLHWDWEALFSTLDSFLASCGKGLQKMRGPVQCLPDPGGKSAGDQVPQAQAVPPRGKQIKIEKLEPPVPRRDFQL